MKRICRSSLAASALAAAAFGAAAAEPLVPEFPPALYGAPPAHAALYSFSDVYRLTLAGPGSVDPRAELAQAPAESPLRLVAAVEFVSPGNKDRPEKRHEFAVKCASYLQESVALVIVDVVTNRQANLHAELVRLLGLNPSGPWPGPTPLGTVAYRTAKENGSWRLDTWIEALTVGTVLPTMPLWLDVDLCVPLHLEESYNATCRSLRIPPGGE